jgi:nicotinate-nucleotide--dimethylbenzimidazole phosphoribosyltransferase
VQRHAGIVDQKNNPVALLAAVGGAEIAALVGAFLECSDRNLPVLCDGFIVSVAAVVALRLNPAVARILFLSTASAEPGHALLLQEMMRKISTTGSSTTTSGGAVLSLSPPVLSMGLRMGEGTAGLLAIPLLRSAAAVWNEMGTIADILG